MPESQSLIGQTISHYHPRKLGGGMGYVFRKCLFHRFHTVWERQAEGRTIGGGSAICGRAINNTAGQEEQPADRIFSVDAVETMQRGQLTCGGYLEDAAKVIGAARVGYSVKVTGVLSECESCSWLCAVGTSGL